MMEIFRCYKLPVNKVSILEQLCRYSLHSKPVGLKHDGTAYIDGTAVQTGQTVKTGQL